MQSACLHMWPQTQPGAPKQALVSLGAKVRITAAAFEWKQRGRQAKTVLVLARVVGVKTRMDGGGGANPRRRRPANVDCARMPTADLRARWPDHKRTCNVLEIQAAAYFKCRFTDITARCTILSQRPVTAKAPPTTAHDRTRRRSRPGRVSRSSTMIGEAS